MLVESSSVVYRRRHRFYTSEDEERSRSPVAPGQYVISSVNNAECTEYLDYPRL
ncbi:hypothetical protein PQG02_32190 (plasmid) [Nostoc sp. UHCC 0926]|uniref:hypothetical protein n=1 Tax=Nostoc sp. UHCC 0926 TaxID=3025190 RepID=UPI0023611F3B|nr:hypothetical protein [Nostoc sp. UHCC 0926]WDD36062.1 hypothetical protein PQG02_32190 [Nostoc sp. UHCC 0926]